MGQTVSKVSDNTNNIILDKALIHGNCYAIENIVDNIIDYYAPIDRNNNTILHTLLKYNYVHTFIKLVSEKNLNHSIRNIIGNSPLDSFVINGSEYVLEGLTLLDRHFNIDYNIKNIYGINIFNRICYRQALNEHTKKLYLDAIVNFNSPLVNNYYPILVFAMKNNDDMLNFIIDKSVEAYDVNYSVVNDIDNNVFHFLCYNNNLTMIKKLHQNIDSSEMTTLINSVDLYGITPLDIAVAKNYDEIIEFLVTKELVNYNKVKPSSYKSIMQVILKNRELIKNALDDIPKPLIDLGNDSDNELEKHIQDKNSIFCTFDLLDLIKKPRQVENIILENNIFEKNNTNETCKNNLQGLEASLNKYIEVESEIDREPLGNLQIAIN